MAQNFYFIAPSIEELRVLEEIDQNRVVWLVHEARM